MEINNTDIVLNKISTQVFEKPPQIHHTVHYYDDDVLSIIDISNSGSEDEVDIVLSFIVGAFFFVWNFLSAITVTEGVSWLLRGKYHESQLILLCPHWIIGFVVPFAVIGTDQVVPLIFITIFSMILPYAFWISVHYRNNEELRMTPFCSCFLRSNTTETEEVVVEPENSNNAIEIVVPHGFDDAAPVEQQQVNDPRRTLIENQLLLKKVVASSQKPTKKTDSGDDVKSFRSNHPKSNLIIHCRRTDDVNNSAVVSTTTGAKVCTICLEEYKFGDNIAWSRNPLCHHVFHKECLVDYLLTSTGTSACPICRNSYNDEELGGI